MALKDIGKVLLAVGGITVVFVLMRLAWLAKSSSLGFDVVGIWRTWGGWILLWLLITVSGFILLAVRRP